MFLSEVNALTLLLTLAVNLALSVFIYFHDRQNVVNRSFSAFLFSIVIWTLSFLAFSRANNPQAALFWRRLTPAGSSLIGAFFLYFTVVFPEGKRPLQLWLRLLILAPGFILSFFSVFSGLLVAGLIVYENTPLFLSKPFFGPLYPLFSLYFISFFLGGVAILLWKYRRLEGREKLQIWYVLFGVGVAGGAGILISLIMPLLGFSGLFTTGPLFTLILAGFISYAFIRHRLLNINDFLSRGTVFFAAIIGGVVLAVAFLTGQPEILLPALTLITFLALSGLVFFRGSWRSVNRAFSLITLLLALWTLGDYFSFSLLDRAEALFWVRFVFAVSSLVPVVVVWFASCFPEGEGRPGWPVLLAVFLPGAVLAASAFFSKNFVLGWSPGGPLGSGLEFGSLFYFFSFYLLITLGYALNLLWNKYQHLSGIFRVQIKYVFLGGLLSTLAVLTTNVILPLFGNFSLTSLGPTLMLIFAGMTAYAIIWHRLMTMELILQKGAAYLAALVVGFGLYLLLLVIFRNFLSCSFNRPVLLATSLAALIVALLYQPLVRLFQLLLEKFFFRGRYDYQETIARISHEITAVIKIEELTRLIVSSFLETMQVTEISFLLREKRGEHFRSVSLNLPRYKKIEIDTNSPIISWLSTKRELLVRDELEDELSHLDPSAEGERAALSEVLGEMERLGMVTWVPISSKEELVGIIALGSKLSGEIFTAEDLTLLATLANQTGVALDNARLYDEVLLMKNYSEDVLQSMSNGVLTTDVRGRVVTFNRMAEEITGLSAATAIGQDCETLWGRQGFLSKAVAATLAGRSLLGEEGTLTAPRRGLVPVSLTSTLLRDSQKKKIGVLLSIQDLSAIKELEDKIRRADKLTALATMAAGMAHEIKNPLSSMKVFVQLLPQKFADPEYRKKLEEILPREINRIDRIVESLLGFARASAPSFYQIDLVGLLDELVNYFKDQAVSSGVEVIKDYAGPIMVEADREQLSQVFSNLILNAIQAMPLGGRLELKVLPTEKEVKVRVSDTGHGMSAETIKKIFDPFFTTKYGGTGLGLTVAHSIIDSHRGSLLVESVVGEGSVFTVTLPLRQKLL